MLPKWFEWCIEHFGKIILALYIAMTAILCVDAKHNYDSAAGQPTAYIQEYAPIPMTAMVDR